MVNQILLAIAFSAIFFTIRTRRMGSEDSDVFGSLADHRPLHPDKLDGGGNSLLEFVSASKFQIWSTGLHNPETILRTKFEHPTLCR
jgi:hypothetical protein